MAIRNIIQKAEQEFPPAIKQELDPVARPELALLSGYVDTVNTNLATTGSTLNTKVDNLSGYSNNTFATITNLATTGSTLSTNLATTGSALQTNLNTVAGNLATTGSTLNTKVDTLSGYSNTTFATITNLASTGSNLQSQINNLDSVYATDASVTTVANNLATTGSTLQTNINTVATNLASTGSANLARINSLSGTLTSTYATIANLATTGSSLQSQINNLDSLYATDASVTTVANNLATTGSTLNTKVDNLSGYSNNTFYTKNNPSGFITNENVVFTTGNQTISGVKNFASRPTVNTVPVAVSGDPTSSLEQYVKNDQGDTVYKGQPVYVGSSNGNNILVKLSSNTGELTSSKTFGLLKQDLLVNEFGYVVTEGPLLNVNTNSANDGDPIWLGPTGNLIFGFANKPQAPQHLVYIGFVEKAHQNQGKIFVKVQNGFEIDELHDVRIINKQNKDVVRYNSASGLWLNSQLNTGDISGISNLQTQIDNRVTNLGAASGIQVMTTGAYNSGTPLSGVVYILI